MEQAKEIFWIAYWIVVASSLAIVVSDFIDEKTRGKMKEAIEGYSYYFGLNTTLFIISALCILLIFVPVLNIAVLLHQLYLYLFNKGEE